MEAAKKGKETPLLAAREATEVAEEAERAVEAVPAESEECLPLGRAGEEALWAAGGGRGSGKRRASMSGARVRLGGATTQRPAVRTSPMGRERLSSQAGGADSSRAGRHRRRFRGSPPPPPPSQPPPPSL